MRTFYNSRRLRIALTLGLGFFSSTLAHAQLGRVAEIIQGSLNESAQYVGAYIRPVGDGLSLGLNNGWYNTAATHNTLGFDLTISLNTIVVPPELQTINVADLTADWANLSFEGTSTEIPNVFGGAIDPNDRFALNIEGQEATSFNALPGVDFPLENGFVPVPTVNLGIGLIKNTDLMIRYIPTINTNGFSANMWGVGVKHDFKQWIPGLKLLPFSMSALVGYNQMNMEVPFVSVSGGTVAQRDESVVMTARALTGQVLISKKLLFFTPYAGIGVNMARTTLAFQGPYEYSTYSYDSGSGTITETQTTVNLEDEIDPLLFETGGLRATVGARIKLAVFTFHGDYTITGSYQLVTAGFGISIR